MFQIIVLATTISLATTVVQAGFSGNQLAYSAAYLPPQFAAEHNYNIPYDFNAGNPYAAPLPVAPLSGPHHYAAVTYSTQPVFKFRSSGGGYGCGPFVRSRPKFAFPAPVPAFYNAPLPVDVGTPSVTYSGFDAPNTVVKFGPPITTTTTTYSTTAAAASGVHVRTPLNAVAGW